MLAGEAAHWLAAGASTPSGAGGRCVVLVAGRPAEDDGRVHPGQRPRVEAGVAAYRANGCDRLVISGGAVRNDFVEAEVMGALARQLGVREPALVLERDARNSWENVGCAAPLLAEHDRIVLVSDPLHVLRVRRYLCRQRPEWCGRIETATHYRPFARALWTPLATLYELLAWSRDRLFYEGARLPNAPPCPHRGGPLG